MPTISIPRPGLLFNLAQCHRGLEHWKKAKFAYESYLRQVPDAPNHKAVLKILEEVDEKVQQQDEKEAAVRAAQRPPERIQTQVPIVLDGAPGRASARSSCTRRTSRPRPGRSRTRAGPSAGRSGASGSGPPWSARCWVWWRRAPSRPATPPGDPAGTYYESTYSGFHSATSRGLRWHDVLWGVGGALVVTGVILLLTSN